MEKQAFSTGIKKLVAYYERKFPDRDTLELWMNKVRDLPDECMPWMVSQITEAHERFPLNLPGVMLKLWPMWLQKHPEKRSTFYSGECSDCDNNGWLHVRKDGYVFAFRCRCGKLMYTAPGAWLSDLLEQGYVEDRVEDMAKYRVPSIGKVVRDFDWSEFVPGGK